MHAHDLLIDEGNQRHVIECADKLLPQLDRVAAFALIIEAVDLGDVLALVIAA